MSEPTTPSAGPAPEEMTRERYHELLAQATLIAIGQTLLLPTKEHVAALHRALNKAALERANLQNILVAVMLDTGQRVLTIPDAVLHDTAVRGIALHVDKPVTGYTQVKLLVPPMPERPQ